MKLDKLPRMTEWIIITILLTILIYLLAPQQLPVSLYKLSLITTAAVVGYWIDRSLFPYARPDQIELWFRDSGDDHSCDGPTSPVIPIMHGSDTAALMAISMLRRAIIVGCAMLAVSLGM